MLMAPWSQEGLHGLGLLAGCRVAAVCTCLAASPQFPPQLPRSVAVRIAADEQEARGMHLVRGRCDCDAVHAPLSGTGVALFPWGPQRQKGRSRGFEQRPVAVCKELNEATGLVLSPVCHPSSPPGVCTPAGQGQPTALFSKWSPPSSQPHLLAYLLSAVGLQLPPAELSCGDRAGGPELQVRPARLLAELCAALPVLAQQASEQVRGAGLPWLLLVLRGSMPLPHSGDPRDDLPGLSSHSVS